MSSQTQFFCMKYKMKQHYGQLRNCSMTYAPSLQFSTSKDALIEEWQNALSLHQVFYEAFSHKTIIQCIKRSTCMRDIEITIYNLLPECKLISLIYVHPVTVGNNVYWRLANDSSRKIRKETTTKNCSRIINHRDLWSNDQPSIITDDVCSTNQCVYFPIT